MNTQTESTKQPDHDHDDKFFKIVIRTLAGHNDKETVKPSDVVAAVRDEAVKEFVKKQWITAGDYALTLPRLSEAELDPTATLKDVGVVEGDVLVLVSRKPQVDG